MREHPWNQRRVTHRHLHDEQNLRDLHALTESWINAIPQGAASNSPHPFDQNPSLEDDTTPEDVLVRLELAVHSAQAEILRVRLPDRELLKDLSWNAGKFCASHRWADTLTRRNSSLAPADKRALLLALCHSPLSYRLGADAFLVRRALTSEVCIELLQCPHRWSETVQMDQATRDELCQQQFHWLCGYFTPLAPSVTPQISRSGSRCILQW
ncbi:hypothetical protein WDW37_08325 [Bdellovibrionota bacterium FG-1]